MKWSICILSVPERALDLKRIKGMLEYQIGDKDIELIIDDGWESVGEKRQRCLDRAKGEYVNFVDDDDIVAHDYVDTIYPLLDGVDYVGFGVQMYEDGKKLKPSYHSLKYKEWGVTEKYWYRNVSHLNPIRTEIARHGRFEGSWAEDANWAAQVEPKSEHYINRPMYFYFYSGKYSLTEANHGDAD